MIRRLTAVFLSLFLFSSVMPVGIYADEPEEETVTETEEITEEQTEEVPEDAEGSGVTGGVSGQEDEAGADAEIPSEGIETENIEAPEETAGPETTAEDPEEDTVQEAEQETVPETLPAEETAEPETITDEEPEEEAVPETDRETVPEILPAEEPAEPDIPEESAGPAEESSEEGSQSAEEEALPAETEEPQTEMIPEEITETEEVIAEESDEEPAAAGEGEGQETVTEELPGEKTPEDPEPEEPSEEIVEETSEVFEAVNTYTVTLDALGGTFSDGTSVNTMTASEGVFYSSSYRPEKKGWEFCGWYISKEFRENQLFDDGHLNKDLTLYAKYEKPYIVTFDNNGIGELHGDSRNGYVSGVSRAEAAYKDGDFIQYSAEAAANIMASASGYAFGGWYFDKACSPSKSVIGYKVYKNCTVYAKWVKVYTVTLEGCGGYSPNQYETEYITVKAGGSLNSAHEIMKNYTCSGKMLEGWYFDKDYKNLLKYPNGYFPDKDVTLYAKWVVPLKITYNANGGKFSDGTATDSGYIVKGKPLVFAARKKKENPEKKGYWFDGWYLDKGCTKEVADDQAFNSMIVTKPLTLYAGYVKTVTVTLDPGSEGAFDEYMAEFAVQQFAKGVSDYDRWKRTMHVMFDGRVDGFGFDPGYVTPNAYNEEYIFDTYCLDKALTKEVNYHDYAFTKDTTLYARYKKRTDPEDEEYIYVTVNLNGGIPDPNDTTCLKYYKDYKRFINTASVTPPAGKQFLGVTRKRNDVSTLIDLDTFTPKKNMTVYAYFVPEYRVYLNAGSGFIDESWQHVGWSSYAPVKTKVVYVAEGSTVGKMYYNYGSADDTMLTNVPGEVFMGWYSDKSYKNFVTYDLSKYPIRKNMNLYAKWGKPGKKDWKKTGKKHRYVLPNGDCYRNMFETIGGKTYYFDKQGYVVYGWKKIEGKWYYFDTEGVMLKGWQKISGNWYYLKADGSMHKGWKKSGKKQYYLNSKGILVTGWQKISGKWYYFDAEGIMQTGWKKISGSRYYLNADGSMQKGWKMLKKKWYYMDSKGIMATGWQKISGKRYYFDSAGVMQTGWKKIKGSYYYLNADGSMQTGWKKLKEKWYYFESSGKMITGKKKIGSKTYTFNSSGVCLNP